MRNVIFIRKYLLKWYKKNGRDFPWRHTDDPYKIMIAEFMLHRTRAEQVVPVYNKFIEQYSDVILLSKAPSKAIKKYTENLGLHWRYKHFVEAAKFIVNNYNGKFPQNHLELRNIPGIGDYISCAISIIAFNNPAPIVDSNIARFINRFFNLGLKGEIRRRKEIKNLAFEVFNFKDCKKLLFALIDFCNTTCRPQYPQCKFCVLRSECLFYKESNFN